MGEPARSSWTDTKLLHMASLSFGGSIPYSFVAAILPAWLAATGASVETIGSFAWATLPFGFKFAWAPFVDRWRPPFGGRRRGWMLLTQVPLVALFCAAMLLDPHAALVLVGFGLLISLLSGTQDIAMDAYAVELMKPVEHGPGAAMRTAFYRAGMIVVGSGGLILAGTAGWTWVFVAIALLMLPSVPLTLTAPEPDVPAPPARSLADAVIGPLFAFFRRDGAVAIALFIILYKFGDNMTEQMMQPFFQQHLKISLIEIGVAQKWLGIGATIAGVFVGGALLPRLGLVRALFVYGVVQAVANMGYAATALAGGDRVVLYSAIVIEKLGTGIGTAGLTTLCMRIVDQRYTAAQFALLTSLFAIGRSVAGDAGGRVAGQMSWPAFFAVTVACALPALMLLLVIHPKLTAEERA